MLLWSLSFPLSILPADVTLVAVYLFFQFMNFYSDFSSICYLSNGFNFLVICLSSAGIIGRHSNGANRAASFAVFMMDYRSE